MANRRMIASNIFDDEDIGRLDYLARLVWIGLFSVVADDQGRMMNSPALIRSRVFLYDLDRVSDKHIEAIIKTLADKKKIICYEKENKKLIQIAKWWIYQTPSWAMPSKYPAPNNWTDRNKYHAPGNKIVTTNWDQQGGICSELRSGQSSPIEEGDVKGDVKGNVNGEGEVEGELHSDQPFSQFSRIFQKETGLPDMSGGVPRYIKSINEMINMGAEPDDLKTAISELRKKDYQIVSPGSCVNAVRNVMGKRKSKKTLAEIIQEA